VLGPIQRRSGNRVRPCARGAAKFANHTNDSVWETLAQRRKTAHICALFKAYAGEPCYLSRGDHDRKIMARKKEQISVNTLCEYDDQTVELTAYRGASDFPL
jgi:hypothetical protein